MTIRKQKSVRSIAVGVSLTLVGLGTAFAAHRAQTTEVAAMELPLTGQTAVATVSTSSKPVPVATSKSAASKTYTVIESGSANVRASGDCKAKLIGEVKHGAKVTVVGSPKDGWYPITIKSRTGWISGNTIGTCKSGKCARLVDHSLCGAKAGKDSSDSTTKPTATKGTATKSAKDVAKEILGTKNSAICPDGRKIIDAFANDGKIRFGCETKKGEDCTLTGEINVQKKLLWRECQWIG